MFSLGKEKMLWKQTHTTKIILLKFDLANLEFCVLNLSSFIVIFLLVFTMSVCVWENNNNIRVIYIYFMILGDQMFELLKKQKSTNLIPSGIVKSMKQTANKLISDVQFNVLKNVSNKMDRNLHRFGKFTVKLLLAWI